VNNVLGFPFIFRGALDVRARAINMEMKLAATHALADLTKEDVPDSVMRAYGVDSMRFGPNYIIPSPFDPRVLTWEAPAVAKAAMETGVARIQIDLDSYPDQRALRRGREAALGHRPGSRRAQRLPEGKRSRSYADEEIAKPILLDGLRSSGRGMTELGPTQRCGNDRPGSIGKLEVYAEELTLRNRRGVTQ
jgi:malate dehydrogenase (oxaloacetate-decarboxylating)(NADP+)